LFPFDALSTGIRTWEAHPRQMDETQCVMGWRETLQSRHLVGAKADKYRIRDGMVYNPGSIYSTPGVTLGGMIAMDLHDALSDRQYEALYEHEV